MKENPKIKESIIQENLKDSNMKKLTEPDENNDRNSEVNKLIEKGNKKLAEMLSQINNKIKIKPIKAKTKTEGVLKNLNVILNKKRNTKEKINSTNIYLSKYRD